jgi:hypothetical protein
MHTVPRMDTSLIAIVACSYLGSFHTLAHMLSTYLLKILLVLDTSLIAIVASIYLRMTLYPRPGTFGPRGHPADPLSSPHCAQTLEAPARAPTLRNVTKKQSAPIGHPQWTLLADATSMRPPIRSTAKDSDAAREDVL